MANERLRAIGWRGPLVCAAAALVFLFATTGSRGSICVSPEEAANRAESELPSVGLPWGRARAFAREGDGWTLRWQPAHGAWLVTAWVPDGPAPIRWRIEVASWLPGARLSRGAAEVLVRSRAGPSLAHERLARRDWRVGNDSLIGALPGGNDVQRVMRLSVGWVGRVLAGLLVAGAISRRLLPAVPERLWSRAVATAALVLAGLAMPATALGFSFFAAEVRPWVTELALVAASVLVLGALIFASYRVPASGSQWPHYALCLGFSAGVVLGAREPTVWVADVLGLGWPLLTLPALAIILGWLAALAAEAGRGLLGSTVWGRIVVGATLLTIAGLERGPMIGIALAVAAAIVSPRSAATAVGVAVIWGWLGGDAVAVCHWVPTIWMVLAFTLGGGLVVMLSAGARDESISNHAPDVIGSTTRSAEIEATIPR